MILRSKGYLRPKISARIRSAALHRESGQAAWVTGMFFLLFLAVLLCMQLQLALYRTASDYLEDALAASNLASAVIDPKEYGISHTLRISDYEQAYDRYLKAVEGNLGLDEARQSTGEGVIAGPVRVVQYVIYNVTEQQVEIWSVSENGVKSMASGMLGNVCAPNGQSIEHTSVYSEIAFEVQGLFGMQNEAHKGKLVDILATAAENE